MPGCTCGQFARKVFLFSLRSAAGSGRSWTLDKQTNQKVSCHPLYQVDGPSCVFMRKRSRVNAVSITTALFGSLFCYRRKFASHPFTPLLISGDCYRLSFGEGNTRVPLFRESRHIGQPPTWVNRPCVPEPFPEVISGASLRKEDLRIMFLSDLQIALAARWTRAFLGHGPTEILPCSNEPQVGRKELTVVNHPHRFMSSMASEKEKFWNIRYGFLWLLLEIFFYFIKTPF